MKQICDVKNDIERAFYGSKDINFNRIRIEGPLDGESAFKECRNIKISDSFFDLRYPFWHDIDLVINDCQMTLSCRAALWYSKNITINRLKSDGVKILRECFNITVIDSYINSPEPFWFCKNININDSELLGEYAFLESENMVLNNLKFKGKYSFQYVKNGVFKNCVFDTKDAFWETKNITVIDSIIKGEYLGWYSDSLKLINCKIIGTQPLCYCKNLVLENCEMIDTDFAFEYSDVVASITNEIISVKNPHIGRIEAYNIKEIIIDENSLGDSNCPITITK